MNESVRAVHNLKAPHPRVWPYPHAPEPKVIACACVIITVKHIIHRAADTEVAEVDAGIQLGDRKGRHLEWKAAESQVAGGHALEIRG